MDRHEEVAAQEEGDLHRHRESALCEITREVQDDEKIVPVIIDFRKLIFRETIVEGEPMERMHFRQRIHHPGVQAVDVDPANIASPDLVPFHDATSTLATPAPAGLRYGPAHRF